MHLIIDTSGKGENEKNFASAHTARLWEGPNPAAGPPEPPRPEFTGMGVRLHLLPNGSSQTIRKKNSECFRDKPKVNVFDVLDALSVRQG